MKAGDDLRRLDRAASRVAQGLIAEGVKPQTRVAHLDKSSDVFFELLFGVAKANAVMVSVNWRLAPPEILHIVNDAEAEILFVGEEYFPVLEKIRGELKTVRKIVTLGGCHVAWESFADWRDRQPATDPLLPANLRTRRCSFTPAPRAAKGAGTDRQFRYCFIGEDLAAGARRPASCLPMSISAAPVGLVGFAGATNHVARFVRPDPRSSARRQVLRFGHDPFLVQAPNP